MSRRRHYHPAFGRPRVEDLGLDDLNAVAQACETPLPNLEAFATDTQKHYGRFELPKPSGGVRVIRPPLRPLRDVQRRILKLLACQTTWPPHLHGGISGRSIFTNARVHVGKQMVANLDVKSFFPSIGIEAVREILAGFGVPSGPVDLLAALITCPDEEGRRCLPQGAPTSPYFANHALARADEQFLAFCAARGLAYTRYIDDIAISAAADIKCHRGTFIKFISEAGYRVAENKVHFHGRHQRQIVTGLLVNDRLRPAPAFIRDLSVLIKAAFWPGGPGLEIMSAVEGVTVSGLKERIAGRIAHVRRFDEREAKRLRNLKFKGPPVFSA